jgi:GTP-binding protein HflX
MNVVHDTLNEIGSGHKPMILVFNKIDALHFPEVHPQPEDTDETPSAPSNLEELKRSWMARLSDHDVVFISARERENIEELRSVLYERVKTIHQERYPYNNFLY